MIVEAVPNRRIAADFGLSESSVRRHAASHLPKVAVRASREEREFDHFRKLKILEKSLYTILKRSLEDRDDPMALRTHGSLLKHYDFELRLGELEDVKRDLEELREEIERREIDR